jgi:two-component system response regulator HydG
VCELEHVVERLVIVGRQPTLTAADLAELAPSGADDPPPLVEARGSLPTLRRVESDYIAWVIARCDGNKTRAAEILGIDVSTIHRREKTGQ